MLNEPHNMGDKNEALYRAGEEEAPKVYVRVHGLSRRSLNNVESKKLLLS